MKKSIKLFCFGFGQVAKYFVKSIIKNNYNFELITTNTKDTKLENFNNLKYKSYYFYNNNFDKDLLKELDTSNKVLISIPPKNSIDLVLKNFSCSFQNKNFNWVTYLSATSVYGDKKGQWVSEKTNPQPSSARGIERLKAENNWMNLYKKFKSPIQIFRLSGIYSVENNIIKRLKMGTVKIAKKNNHFFSRIHVEDAAEILYLSLNKISPGNIFNISDDYPCSNYEITKYASDLIQMKTPETVKIKDIKGKMLKEFYKDSKKVNNEKMKNFFDYNLKYPTFKEGLDSVINQTR